MTSRRFRIERDADGLPARLVWMGDGGYGDVPLVANARVLAHAWRHDSRPPYEVVREAEAYPVRAEEKGSARDGM